MNINATLIGQMISFALLVWFTMKFVWPPLTKALAERQQRIADGLAAGERGRQGSGWRRRKRPRSCTRRMPTPPRCSPRPRGAPPG